MNEPRNMDTGDNERLLEDILRHAEPRPRPSDAASERAFIALHDEWRQITNKRRWQRRTSFAAIAATLVVAVLAGTQWLGNERPPAGFVRLDVLRASGGQVRHNTVEYTASDLVTAGLRLQHGDELATSPATRLALSWDGGSLRLDEATRVRFDNARLLTLLSGSVYFDSTPFGMNAAASARLEIDTALGRVSHVGTQFQVGMAEDTLRVSVREGQVQVAGDRIDVTLVKGEGMSLSGAGQFERHAVAAYDPAWQWATEIAPEVQLRGRTTAEVLEWIARETGREVRFATDAARQLATSEPRGISSLAPLPALRTIPFMTSLQTSLSDGYIVVEVIDANKQ